MPQRLDARPRSSGMRPCPAAVVGPYQIYSPPTGQRHDTSKDWQRDMRAHSTATSPVHSGRRFCQCSASARQFHYHVRIRLQQFDWWKKVGCPCILMERILLRQNNINGRVTTSNNRSASWPFLPSPLKVALYASLWPVYQPPWESCTCRPCSVALYTARNKNMSDNGNRGLFSVNTGPFPSALVLMKCHVGPMSAVGANPFSKTLYLPTIVNGHGRRPPASDFVLAHSDIDIQNIPRGRR